MTKDFFGDSFLFFQIKIIESGRISAKCTKGLFSGLNCFRALFVPPRGRRVSGGGRMDSVVRLFPPAIFTERVVNVCIAFWEERDNYVFEKVAKDKIFFC